MCYKGKCFYCIPVDTGCLVLAIMSAVANGVIFLGCIIGGIIIIASILTSDETHGHDLGLEMMSDFGLAIISVIAMIFFAVLAVVSLISFIFSAILCNGICKRRPGQVKAYFNYGVVAVVLAAMGSAVIIAEGGPYSTTGGSLGFLGCVVHSLFLVLVHHTHAKLVADVAINDQINLVDDSKQLKC